jgi:hypothetical protein
VYRSNKNPLNREEVVALNSIVQRIGFKIPELWDPDFLDGLPTGRVDSASAPGNSSKKVDVTHLKDGFLRLLNLEPTKRGFAFEKFLKEIFSAFGLEPHSSFRLVGEQIDGSLQLGGDTYLIEAKWTQAPVSQSDLLAFKGKVEAKSTWSRGLFISYTGFSTDGIEAFGRGRSTNLISLTGEDIHFVLDGRIDLSELLNKKARKAAETGQFHTRCYDLLVGS